MVAFNQKVFAFRVAISHAKHASHITPGENGSYCSERRKESKLQAPEEPRGKTCEVLQQQLSTEKSTLRSTVITTLLNL